MGRYRGYTVALPMLVLVAGCSSQEPFLKKQAELEARLDQVVQAQAAANARLTELAATIADVQSQQKAQGLEVEQLKPGYRELKISLENTSQKLEKLAGETAAKQVKIPEPAVVPAPKETTPPVEPVAIAPVVPVSPTAPTGGPQLSAAAPSVTEPTRGLEANEAYQKAFRLYMADKFTESLTAFEGFLAAYPNHEYAANAQYWIGECLYSLKNYAWAVDAFNKVISGYPKSSKVPDAMLKGAFAMFGQGQGDKAREMLQRLVETYPRSAAAGKAKERLAKEQKK